MKPPEIQALSITSNYFKLLINEIQHTFKQKHSLLELPKTFQLYGYGDYNESEPSLKTDFETIGTEFINGKYLYDKTRQAYKGRPIIKLNKYYSSIILLYIGSTNFREFIDQFSLENDEFDEQISLLYNEKVNRTYYYISYYYGEDNKLLKGETVISENFKKIRHTYVYPQDDGSFKTHHNSGTIVRREDTLHMNTKTLLDGKLVQGGSEIYYIGHSDPSNTNYLVGTYSTFDIYTQPVAGKSIFEKCNSKDEMKEKSKNRFIPPYIALELRNSRIITKSSVPKHYHELSENAPYASIYGKTPGEYVFTFNFQDDYKEMLKIKISNSDYRIVPLTEEVYIEKDHFQLLNKGSILHFSFKFTGLIILDKVDIYFKSYYLNGDNKTEYGVFSGIDNENRLVSGKVKIDFKPSK